MSNDKNNTKKTDIKGKEFAFQTFRRFKDTKKTLIEEKDYFSLFLLHIQYVPKILSFSIKSIAIIAILFLFFGNIGHSNSTTKTVPLSQALDSSKHVAATQLELDSANGDYATLYQKALDRLNDPGYGKLTASEKDKLAKEYVKKKYNLEP